MVFAKYPITDYNNLNVDWMVDKLRENTDNIDLNAAGLTAETEAREAADSAEKEAREQADANLQAQIDILSPFNVTDYLAVNKKSLPGQILLIGDSYLAGWTPDGDVTDWGTVLAGSLGKTIGTDLFRYPLGGAGFCNAPGGRTFISLLNESAADPAIDASKVTYIIAAGGWNDRGFTLEAMAAAVRSFYATARSLYPNSIVYVANVGYGSGSTYTTYQKAAVSDGYSHGNPLGDLWTVLAAHASDYLSSDGIHPNADGNAALAEAIYQKLFTGDYKGDIWGPLNVASGQTNLVLNASVADHILRIQNYTSGSPVGVSNSLTSGSANGSNLWLTVTGFPFSANAAAYHQFTFPVLAFDGTNYLSGMMTCRLSGNSLLFYPEIINANRNNWLGFSSLREIMIPSFDASIPYNTI